MSLRDSVLLSYKQLCELIAASARHSQQEEGTPIEPSV